LVLGSIALATHRNGSSRNNSSLAGIQGEFQGQIT
jgi:hypothetical protein